MTTNESYTTPGTYKICVAVNNALNYGQNASGTINVTNGATNPGLSCPANSTGTYPNCTCNPSNIASISLYNV